MLMKIGILMISKRKIFILWLLLLTLVHHHLLLISLQLFHIYNVCLLLLNVWTILSFILLNVFVLISVKIIVIINIFIKICIIEKLLSITKWFSIVSFYKVFLVICLRIRLMSRCIFIWRDRTVWCLRCQIICLEFLSLRGWFYLIFLFQSLFVLLYAIIMLLYSNIFTIVVDIIWVLHILSDKIFLQRGKILIFLLILN